MLAKTTQLVIGTQWMDVVSSVLDALMLHCTRPALHRQQSAPWSVDGALILVVLTSKDPRKHRASQPSSWPLQEAKTSRPKGIQVGLQSLNSFLCLPPYICSTEETANLPMPEKATPLKML
jgi:hypothetical protein